MTWPNHVSSISKSVNAHGIHSHQPKNRRQKSKNIKHANKTWASAYPVFKYTTSKVVASSDMAKNMAKNWPKNPSKMVSYPLCSTSSSNFILKFRHQRIVAALKIFLNAETGLCRSLLVKFLSALWTIQTWARSQTSLRLYSSSLLLAYDARVLKYHLLFSRSSSNSLAASPNGSLSPVSMDGSGKSINSTYSNWPTQQYNHVNGNCANGIAGHTSSDSKTGSSIAAGETIQLYKQLQRSHSAHNNYDEVSPSHRINYDYDLPAVFTQIPFSLRQIGYERHPQKLRLSIG